MVPIHTLAMIIGPFEGCPPLMIGRDRDMGCKRHVAGWGQARTAGATSITGTWWSIFGHDHPPVLDAAGRDVVRGDRSDQYLGAGATTVAYMSERSRPGDRSEQYLGAGAATVAYGSE
ncbi:hypothetical protein CFP66_00615 [Pseudonocardia sp. MH-G8]|nr:hypothetical protein CFP66_00615 [Pseudonocardia sp. MH-G8]